MAGLPDLLTMEEATRLIRVGRTKGYAMAREWIATGGQSGLPVVDFGHVLRVPRHALEQLIGAELTGESGAGAAAEAQDEATRAAPTPTEVTPPATEPGTMPSPRSSTRRSRRSQNQPSNQLNLFGPTPTDDA